MLSRQAVGAVEAVLSAPGGESTGVREKLAPLLAAGPVQLQPQLRRLSEERPGHTRLFRVGGVKVYLTYNCWSKDDLRLAEIWLKVSPQQGSTVDGMLDTFAKTFSLAIQGGAPLADLVRVHKGSRFEPCGPTGCPEVPVCSSIPDLIVRFLEVKFLRPGPGAAGGFVEEGAALTADEVAAAEATAADEDGGGSGLYCPDCHAELLYHGGCLRCRDASCGFVRCG